MKKSKIIVPALALLTLSAAASVSGSVAWFTANRVASFDAGSFAVVNTKDNLDCILSSGVGTSVSGNVISRTAGASLTDASFDHVNEKFIIPDADGKKIERVIPLSAATLGSAATGANLYRDDDVYSAFTWHADFSVSYSISATDEIGLFMDAATSWVAIKEHLAAETVVPAGTYFSDGTLSTAAVLDETTVEQETVYKIHETGDYYRAVQDTGKGFRVAFIPENAETDETNVNASTRNKRVWAPNQTSTNSKYIDVTSGPVVETDVESANYCKPETAPALPNGTAYTSPALLSGDVADKIAAPTDEDETAVATAKNCLGVFSIGENNANAGKSVHLKYTIVVWYEGTDPEIVNTADTIYETVDAHFDFKAVVMA